MASLSRREQWIALLIEIAEPVIDRFLSRTILTDFPIKFSSHLSPDLYAKNRVKVHVELFARTLLGVSPLFRHPDENAAICKKTLEMIQIAFGITRLGDLRSPASNKESLDATPQSPPLLAFYQMDRQLIVEMALIILAFVRVPLLWQSIPLGTQQEILKVAHFAVTQFKPHNNNWLLFQAIIDLFLTKQRYRGYNAMRRVMENLARIESYYVGDGWYKDGEVFHMDYYNSFVIHPFLVDIYRELGQTILYQRAVGRMLRHADFLERLISSDGTYPIFGRSAVYRTGVFHALAYAPYHWTGSPQNLFKLAAAREGMTAVLERSFKTELMKTTLAINPLDEGEPRLTGNFGKEWKYLTLGFTGEQPGIADGYSNSGSVYYALLIFAPVGLPESHPFWSMNDEEGGGWSQRKAWRGEEIRKDAAITF
jgi:hypothetical protein